MMAATVTAAPPAAVPQRVHGTLHFGQRSIGATRLALIQQESSYRQHTELAAGLESQLRRSYDEPGGYGPQKFSVPARRWEWQLDSG